MSTTSSLSPHLIEEANRFRIGDRVKINPDSKSGWVVDWLSLTDAEVRGIMVKHVSVVITIKHDGDQLTDGFYPDDLLPA